jgi:hypothetical protein
VGRHVFCLLYKHLKQIKIGLHDNSSDPWEPLLHCCPSLDEKGKSWLIAAHICGALISRVSRWAVGTYCSSA